MCSLVSRTSTDGSGHCWSSCSITRTPAKQAAQLRQLGRYLGSLSAELLARAAELDGRVGDPPGRVVIDAWAEW